jgi:hypothetical protein
MGQCSSRKVELRSTNLERRVIQSRVVRHDAIAQECRRLPICGANDSKALKIVVVDFGDLCCDHPQVRARQRENNKRRRLLAKQRADSAGSSPLRPNGAPPLLGAEQMVPVSAVQHAISRTGRNR